MSRARNRDSEPGLAGLVRNKLSAGVRHTRQRAPALLEGLRRLKARGMDRVCVSTGDSLKW